ncbi:Plasmodium exported protein, unknown function [Plasmodium reichenowi]|uniref:Uncharacterized protein n=1 Tax=Plasmodium reichenowi TaxID=5854 RepID=A0A2P9DCG6_PLARE|nr:Plasmodium exported protein, unknown function [Plasmodium reichenowi]
MFFLFFKLFIFILILNIILGFNKNNNNVINIFEKTPNNKKFHIRINKSLAECIKNENTNYESKEFDLLYKELVIQKLENYERLMELRKKEKNYEKKKRRDKKWQDKVVRSKIKAYNLLNGDYKKYYEIRKKIKNKLYEIIFKGTKFWKDLGFFLEVLGIYAVECHFFYIIGSLIYILEGFKLVSGLATYFIVCNVIFGIFILLIVLTVVIVILLVIWLWPKDDKNITNKMLEPN